MRERNEMILADVIEARAEKDPDRDVLTFEHLTLDGGATPDEIRTYADLWRNGNRLAAELRRRGVERGDRFGLILRNHPEFVETMIAASALGAAFVPIDPRTKGEKLAYMLGNAGCRGVIVADYCLAELAAVRGDLPGVEFVLGLETGEDGAPPMGSFSGVESLREVFEKDAPTVNPLDAEASDPYQIIYTSGTTGDPKGVVRKNLGSAFGMLGAIFGYDRDRTRPYTGLSLTHGNAQAVTLGPALQMGVRAVFSRRFTKSRLWDACRAHGCTTFSLLGGMATAIYSEPDKPNDAENPVEVVVSAGMPQAIWESFEKRFNIKIFEWYGTVEGGVAFNPPGTGPVGSFGKSPPNQEMKILDEDDNECPPGVPGEICSRPADGSRVEVEYFKNKQASESKTRGGWLRSGDVGRTDEEGWLYFDYRKGGGIRRSGDFINPGFVERAIAEHPEVDDVFVYGVPAASGAPGESDVVAAIVASDSGKLDPQTVFARCREKLESNFVPTYLQLVDVIPKTASEKPQERFLLADFAPDKPNIVTEER